MATKSAKRGLRWTLAEAADDGEDAASVFSSAGERSVSFVIRFLAGIFRRGFVDHRLADHVFLAGPVAQVEQLAALAAKGEFGVRVGVGGLAADWDNASISRRDTAGLVDYSTIALRSGQPSENAGCLARRRGWGREWASARERFADARRTRNSTDAADQVVILRFGDFDRGQRAGRRANPRRHSRRRIR